MDGSGASFAGQGGAGTPSICESACSSAVLGTVRIELMAWPIGAAPLASES